MADIFDAENEVKSNWVKFSKIGDKVAGTLIAVREVPNTFPGKEGTMQKVYDIKCDVGEFHEVDDEKKVIEPAVKVHPNEIYSLSKDSLDKQLRNVKVGTKIGLKFIEVIPATTKGFSPFKNVKVYISKDSSGQDVMDQGYMEEVSNSNF